MKKDMTPSESLSMLKSQLILSYIFWATLLLKMYCEFDDKVQTASTDGETIKINTNFWEKLSFEHKRFLMVHELCHCVLKHHLRRGKRDGILWNIACDYAVNILLKKVGFDVPVECLLDDAYDNMGAEAIYAILEKEFVKYCGRINEKSSGEFGYSFGEVIDFNGDDPQSNDHEWSGRIEQAVRASRSCGNSHENLERLVNLNKKSRIPWQEITQRFVQVKAKNDYDWRQPNKRYISTDMYLPCLRSFEIGKILFIADTSGSIGEEEINITGSEVQSAVIQVKADFYIMWVDNKFQGIQHIDPNVYPLKLKPKGGGGTDFRPGFDWIEKQYFDPLCVIYLTDGFCNSFPREPDYPVLWIVTSRDEFKPPFGEVTYWYN